jgi:luciferase family oxidoreductase group 1
LQQPNAYTPSYEEQIRDVLALLRGTYRSADDVEAHAYPGEGADLEVWILGASGGESATVAGSNGLRFAASYHHSPSTVLDAVEAYRAAFLPSDELARPYISVSADVVVADDDETATRLASGYGLWVRSIRTGAGAIAFPTPEAAAAHEWSDEDRALVKDRIDTQLVGSPQTVADKLEQLQRATGADELAVTTITHRHADRVRSYDLLAQEWQRRQN